MHSIGVYMTWIDWAISSGDAVCLDISLARNVCTMYVQALRIDVACLLIIAGCKRNS